MADAQQATAMPVAKQTLTLAALEYLFGKNYKRIYAYDNESSKLFGPNNVCWYPETTKAARELKNSFDKEFMGFELVASVIMLVSKQDYPGKNTWTYANANIYDKKGRYIVGNLIVRDKMTGALKVWNHDAWVGVYNYSTWGSEKYTGIAIFSKQFVEDPEFRTALFAGQNIKSR